MHQSVEVDSSSRGAVVRSIPVLSLLASMILCNVSVAQDSATFSCPAGTADVMKYFVMQKSLREQHFMHGSVNSIYTKVFLMRISAPAGTGFG